MCGLTGFIKGDLTDKSCKNIIKKMSGEILPRGTDDFGFFEDKNVCFAHRRLSIRDLGSGHQPMGFKYKNNNYIIVYNGEIYNTSLLKQKVLAAGLDVESNCDTELVLKCFAIDGVKCLQYLNGIFAFCVYNQTKNTIVLARDQMGVKPLFYYHSKNTFAFASEIKCLFKHKNIKVVVDKKGLRELFGIMPARTPGVTIYKNIKEVKAGHYVMLKNNLLTSCQYFKLESKVHKHNTLQTSTFLKNKITDIVKNQLVSDTSIGMFLSGGVDSSIITALSSDYIKNNLKTFSVDYENSEKNFVASDFTPARDNYYINLMVDKFKINHKYHVLKNADLFKSLKQAMIARDYPAMADIDSSLLLFCEKVKKDITVSLSGEFADEIFCGYPWFYREDTKNAKTFPWAVSVELRENTISKKLKNLLNIKKYIENNFKNALADVPLMENESEDNKKMKIYSYLTMQYFGVNLLERSDRMSMQSTMEIRVPFTDSELVQYVYNIPWKMKNVGGYEKGILRKAFENIVPDEVLYRKKSPYPKTHHNKYAYLVEKSVKKLLKQKNSKVWQIVDRDYIEKVLSEKGNLKRPWFGQLMNKPQYLAFILQIDMWIKHYNVVFEI